AACSSRTFPTTPANCWPSCRPQQWTWPSMPATSTPAWRVAWCKRALPSHQTTGGAAGSGGASTTRSVSTLNGARTPRARTPFRGGEVAGAGQGQHPPGVPERGAAGQPRRGQGPDEVLVHGDVVALDDDGHPLGARRALGPRAFRGRWDGSGRGRAALQRVGA